MMVAAIVLAGIALEPLVWPRLNEQISSRPAVAGLGALLGLLVVAALAWVFHGREAWLGLAVFVALPFRVPLTLGGDTANLLIPLYVVILAGAIALCVGASTVPDDDPPKAVRRLDVLLAVVVVLYVAQSLYSSDLEHAVKNIGFFYIPFLVLYRLLRQVPWSAELLRRCLYILVGLALLFAAIGFAEFATKHLLISNAKVLSANEIKPYFRVNSLFFDPNIYGRFLALVIIVLATNLLWNARSR